MSDTFKKKYLNSILPAIVSSVVLGTFSIVDGLFIGNKIGDMGLAAINYACPITAFIQAVGFGIGMGGSICISIAKGKGNKEEEKAFLFHTYLLLLICSFVMMIVFFGVKKNLLEIFGAKGETLFIANEYITVILYATIFQVFGQGMVCICRNYRHNLLTMLAMSVGFIVNIFLDYLFIFVLEYSLMGAALATCIAQFITSIFCIAIIGINKHSSKFCFKSTIIKRIALNSVAPFGTFFAPNIILILINKVANIYGGDIAVAAYTAVSYVTFMSLRLIQGVGDGAQPLFSYYHGANNVKLERKTFAYSICIAISISLFLMLFCILFRNQISYIFGLSEEARNIFKTCLWISATSFICLAVIRISMSFFYAKEQKLFSSILVYGEPIIGGMIILIFPFFMDPLNGIWISTPISQICVFILSIFLIIKSRKVNLCIEFK